MGVRFPSVVSNTVLAAPPASGVETALLTTPPLTLPLDFAQVFIFWSAEMNIGAGTTSAVMRIRQGTTLSGTLIYNGSNIAVTASTIFNFSGVWLDTPGAVAGQQYTLSFLGNGTTGAWGVGAGHTLLAFAL